MAKMVGMNANYREVAGVLRTFEGEKAFAREVLNKMVEAGSKRTFNSVNATLAAMATKGYVSKAKGETLAYIDLKPALDAEQLDKRVLRDFEEAKNKQLKNALNHLFPQKLIPVMIQLSGIDPDKKVNEITKEERKAFVQLIKNVPFTISGVRDFKEAIITKGGVSVKEVNPSTMESKKVKGLYFAGEVLDVDAYTGGFNLQIAFSTGRLAGQLKK